MIDSEEIAKVIVNKLAESFDSVGETLVLVREHEKDPALVEAFSSHVGDIFHSITFKLLDQIYAQHPQLKSPGWDDPIR